ncbi:MAG: hypothetical protein ACOX1F_05775 [Erysipelotrichaceae bacterium]|jgi:hypothetical protein
MRDKKKKWINTLLFTIGGAVVGYVYYRLIGCPNGGCIITSNPYSSMAYMGVIGWLLSGAFEKEEIN